jgi:alpha-amylase
VRRTPGIYALLLVACCVAGRSPPAVPQTRPPAASDAWWNGAIVYEVFVRSFRDSDGDGKGDLAGLVEKLDYLNDGDDATDTDLGVDAIWLMPIHPSPSYHGYDVTDYDGVNPEYGTPADLDRLVAGCHARGIRVILDWVPNHTSAAHPWFVDSASSAAAPHRGWYVWRAVDPGWTQPFGSGPAWFPGATGYYYAVFGRGMPDLDWTRAAVRSEMAAAAGRWIARGVDGFRLDAIRYLVENGPGAQQDQPETIRDLAEFVASVRAARPDAMVVGEAWADTATISRYFGATSTIPSGDGVPLLFDFPLAEAILDGVSRGSAAGIAAALDAVARAYPAGTGDAPFLSNHDQVRVATRLGADPAKLRVAAAILLTLQGSPFIYYGEEVGLRNGGCPGDECKRTPFAWDGTVAGGFTTGTPWWPPSPGTGSANVASQTSDPASLLSRYRRLIRVRKASPALSRGGTTRLATEGSAVLAYVRLDPGETVLVAHNLGGGVSTERFAVPWTSAAPLFADAGASLAAESGGFALSLPPGGSGVWRLH